MSKKRILMLCASKGEQFGGMECQVLNLITAMSKQNDYKFALAGSQNLCSRLPKKQASYQLPLHLNRRNPILLFQLYEAIRRFQPDLVHCHGQKAAQLLTKLRFIYPNCLRVATVHGDKRNHRELKHFHKTITVSKHLHKKLSRSGLHNQLIENGVPAYKGKVLKKEELCERFNLDASIPLFIAAARLAPVKNFDTLVKAFHGLRANLIIFGDGPEKDALMQLAGPNTIIAGHNKNVIETYNAADALLVSSHREGMSLSMIEALKQQTLVLSSPVSGALELLPKSCLLDVSSSNRLRKDLEQKMGKLNKLRKDSAKPFAYAKKHLTLDRMSRETQTLYAALLHS